MMELILFALSIVWPVFMIYGAYKLLATHQLVQGLLKDRQRKMQLKWESGQVQGILNNMSEEGVLQKMTTVERVELHEILAKEYPVWYSIYGKEMTYIPRNR